MNTPSDLNAYYSASPESHSAKMDAYIQFMHAAHAGDAEMVNKENCCSKPYSIDFFCILADS